MFDSFATLINRFVGEDRKVSLTQAKAIIEAIEHDVDLAKKILAVIENAHGPLTTPPPAIEVTDLPETTQTSEE